MKESELQQRVKLKAAQKGTRLWRNNVGATYDQNGRFIRFGLANDSKAMNEVVKSSDLIGIQPVLITPDMVGKTIGQFVGYEIKPSGWKFKATPREKAQLAFINLVLKLGGEAKFITDLDQI